MPVAPVSAAVKPCVGKVWGGGMRVSLAWMLPAIAAMSLLFGSPVVATPVALAEEAVLIPGASPFKRINPIYPLIRGAYPLIGVNFHDDVDPQLVDYSQNPLASDRALREGVGQGELAVRAIDGKVVVIGESMGAMVGARLAKELADSPDPPSPDDIRFVLIASPEEGVAKYFAEGTYIPLLNYRVTRGPESPYLTTIVVGEYDGWADPPDRPWNLVALANAMLGVVYSHGPAIWGVDPSAVPASNRTVDGTVTTYFVQASNLPLTQPFRDIGIPDSVMDRADQLLRPIVDAGYVRHDRPGDTRPYLSEGMIRHNVVAVPLAPAAPPARSGLDGHRRAAPDVRHPKAMSEGSGNNPDRVGSRHPARGGLRAG